MSNIKIISKGLLTTVQDLGRFGYRSQGIPTAGAMDQASAKLANLLVGNKENDTLIECTMMGPKIEFNCDTYIAITGAEVEVFIDDIRKECNSTIAVSSGSLLRFGRSHRGCRFYIAFASGLVAPYILHSTSHDTISNIGHPPLKKGDTLKINDTRQSSYLIEITPLINTLLKASLKVYPGPEFHIIKDLELDSLLFKIDPSSNRMSYILQTEYNLQHSHEMISSGVLPGTIQLTPAGQWIVLMRDAQTTGGYPRVLQIAEEDLNRVAQCRGGESISFEFVPI